MSIDSELIRMGVIRPTCNQNHSSKNILSVTFQGKAYLNYKEARAKVRQLNIKSPHKWKRYCYIHDLPFGVPSNPDLVYRRKGWINYRDWLGVKVIKIVKRIKSRKKSNKANIKTKTFFIKKELDVLKYNRFKKLASKRMPKALNSIKLIGNLSNRSMYGYSEEDYEKIFKQILKSLRNLKKKYRK
jgi:hypothetical protein|tara:strand:+ start:755 stop:1312 length:558 start_codon:yes stop_codon:yes gene_type:complete